jgi:YVTN family beta-propeller protein
MAYMTERGGDIFALNMTNGKTDNIHIGTLPSAVAINRNTNMIYVADAVNNAVAVINGSTNCLLTKIHVGKEPRSLAIDPTRNMIYVTNMFPGTVSSINGTTNSLTAVVQVNINPVNAGFVKCNDNRLHQNFTRYDIGTKIV